MKVHVEERSQGTHGDYVGFTKIAEIEWDNESYQFNVTGVWQRDGDLTLWYANDSGCSCPSVWENTCELDRLFSLLSITERLEEQKRRKHHEEFPYSPGVDWDDWIRFRAAVDEAFDRLRRHNQ